MPCIYYMKWSISVTTDDLRWEPYYVWLINEALNVICCGRATLGQVGGRRGEAGDTAAWVYVVFTDGLWKCLNTAEDEVRWAGELAFLYQASKRAGK